MRDYDIVVTKVYSEFNGDPPREYHVVIRDVEAKEDVARVKFSGPIWRQLFGEEA